MFGLRINLLLHDIPKWPWLYWPLFLLSDRIYVVNLALIDFVIRDNRIIQFNGWVDKRGWGNKVIILRHLDNDKFSMEANKRSVQMAHDCVSPMRKERSEEYFLGGYIAHCLQVKKAVGLYVGMHLEELRTNGIRVLCLRGMFDVFLRSYASKLMDLLILPILLLVWAQQIAVQAYRRVRITSKHVQRKKGGICIDLVHGPALDECTRLPLTGVMSDVFLVESEGAFRLGNHIFLAFGWGGHAIFEHSKKLQDMGATVIGTEVSQVSLTMPEFLNILYTNFRRWLSLWFFSHAPVGGWSLMMRWTQLKYQLDLFKAQLAFVHIVPDVYLSRLDYSYRHHALGAECEYLGINFVGICHSPSGGAGYTPQQGTISFAAYLTYKPIFWENFYPTWKRSGTDLKDVGSWRSDFILQAKRDGVLRKKRCQLIQYLGKRFIVALHLPVPSTILYDQQAIELWMKWLSELVQRNDDVAFIIFPRRFSNSPKYFHELVQTMIEPGRCELAEDLAPEWKQFYPWVPMCNMVIGCSYSDAVIEALAAGCPALSYADVGMGANELHQFESSLVAFDGNMLNSALQAAKSGAWPTKEQWKRVHDRLVGVADGHSIDRIKSHLYPSLK